MTQALKGKFQGPQRVTMERAVTIKQAYMTEVQDAGKSADATGYRKWSQSHKGMQVMEYNIRLLLKLKDKLPAFV